MRKAAALSYAAVGSGVLLLAWAGVTVLWKEPITSLQAQRAQVELEHQLELHNTVQPVTATVGSKPRPNARIWTRRSSGGCTLRWNFPSRMKNTASASGTAFFPQPLRWGQSM